MKAEASATTPERVAPTETRPIIADDGWSARVKPRGRIAERITMLLENNPYPQDSRVRYEAESLVSVGHSVEVVAPRGKGQVRCECVNGVEVRRYRALDWPRLGALGIIPEYLGAWLALHIAALRALLHGSTVLHLHNPPDILFLAGAVFRAARRKVVFDHHDLAPELTKVRFGSGVLERAARAGERLTFAVANHVLAANESHSEIARGRGRMRSAEVTVVRNGPPASWTRLPMRVRPGRLAPVRLAYIGTIGKQDGVEGIAEILACLSRRRPAVEAVVTVIGDGGARPALEAALERYGVDEKVTITGWVDAAHVPELLQEADVCVDPAPTTLLNERSTMIKVMEYLALGKPVVAYDLLETRRTARDAALLAPAGDAEAFAERIAMLTDDAGLRFRLAYRARDRARELTWDRSEIALLNAYAALRRNDDGR
jgi:glycosyltransferase involved in cell wall biosynthesis